LDNLSCQLTSTNTIIYNMRWIKPNTNSNANSAYSYTNAYPRTNSYTNAYPRTNSYTHSHTRTNRNAYARCGTHSAFRPDDKRHCLWLGNRSQSLGLVGVNPMGRCCGFKRRCRICIHSTNIRHALH
jgi:hypothetical protein